MTGGTSGHSPQAPLLPGVLATAVGGALGALGRWELTDVFPVAAGHFPWPVLMINVAGSGLLASLPLLAVARRRPWVALLLGPGLLGGFTTMSAASTDTFLLLDRGRIAMALAYCLGTLAAALLAVLAVDRLTTAEQRREFESMEGDE